KIENRGSARVSVIAGRVPAQRNGVRGRRRDGERRDRGRRFDVDRSTRAHDLERSASVRVEYERSARTTPLSGEDALAILIYVEGVARRQTEDKMVNSENRIGPNRRQAQSQGQDKAKTHLDAFPRCSGPSDPSHAFPGNRRAITLARDRIERPVSGEHIVRLCDCLHYLCGFSFAVAIFLDETTRRRRSSQSGGGRFASTTDGILTSRVRCPVIAGNARYTRPFESRMSGPPRW